MSLDFSNSKLWMQPCDSGIVQVRREWANSIQIFTHSSGYVPKLLPWCGRD